MPKLRSQLSKITDYPAYLEQCWQEHLQPKPDDVPTVISTFAGCGGSSLGYSMAGFRELLAVEWNDNAVATFKLNFPDVPVYHGDINKLTVERCLELAGIEPGQLDILDGSPPCQGFSTAGRRKFGDDRNQLFRQFVRLLQGLKPKVFVMENVSGLVKGKMKLIFAEIMRELKASGYKVSCRLLNAKYFGVPQSRERLIFIGVREDLGIEPGHPKAETKPVTVRQALEGIESLEGPIPTYGTKVQECCQGMKQGTTASDFYRKNWGFNLYRLAWDKPAPTFTKGGGACGLIHPSLPRKCIKEEYQAVMSFPRQYKLVGNEENARARLGNSVPPLMMRSIACHIRQEILNNG
jgi:DNA (cytosine-5)-methyltransferase 1